MNEWPYVFESNFADPTHMDNVVNAFEWPTLLACFNNTQGHGRANTREQ
tara:strand:- start:1186 stop:1332 length:147 start_codon:yes stop_codon:yes gene_type:complete